MSKGYEPSESSSNQQVSSQSNQEFQNKLFPQISNDVIDEEDIQIEISN